MSSPACSRRRFLEFLGASRLVTAAPATPADAINVFDMMKVAEKNIAPQHWDYLMTGVDDNLTVQANRDGFQHYQIRSRRFVDIAAVDTTIELFGRRYASPVMLAPCGSQRAFHDDGELAALRAARSQGSQMIYSTWASFHVREAARESGDHRLWFQLYPTNDWNVTTRLIAAAEDAGCPVVMLTADSPAGGNRETTRRWKRDEPQCRACHTQAPLPAHPMFRGLDISRVHSHLYPTTWDLVDRIRRVTRMKVVIKGVVTGEDAAECVTNGVDAIVVSNHGGRQDETLLSTIEVLPEIITAVNGRFPVLIDSGFRRGTDIFKALALGARAICIGRPYLWGLGAYGQPGVERVLQLLRAELMVTMRMAGTTAIAKITPSHVQRRVA